MNLRNICPKNDFNVLLKADVLGFQITKAIVSIKKDIGVIVIHTFMNKCCSKFPI